MTAPDSDRKLTVRYTITLDDFVTAQTSQMRRVIVTGTAIFLVVIALGAVLWGSGEAALGFGCAALGLLGLAMIHVRPFRRGLMRRRVAPLVGQVSEITLTDEGIEVRQTSVHAQIAWDALTRVDETRSAVSVLSGGVTRLTIPKRAFATDAEAAAFIGQLRRRIEGAGPR